MPESLLLLVILLLFTSCCCWNPYVDGNQLVLVSSLCKCLVTDTVCVVGGLSVAE
jgi:hypothetical protein